jgi:DNA gyrase/topoisomerase IV subunit B
MTESRYTPDDIKPIDMMTAIRMRPAMYVGLLEEPAAINTLLRESLCIAFDNASSGCATEVVISIHADGSASVRDNGSGMSVEVGRDGLTAIEMLLTKLYACREAKRSLVARNQCGVGIVVTNALSEWLIAETVQDGWRWRQRYVRGYAESPVEKQERCSDSWQQIHFRPDPEIFGAAQLSPEYFIQWFQQQAFDLGNATVRLIHNDKTVRLMPQP